MRVYQFLGYSTYFFYFLWLTNRENFPLVKSFLLQALDSKSGREGKKDMRRSIQEKKFEVDLRKRRFPLLEGKKK